MSSGGGYDFVNWYGYQPHKHTYGWSFELTRTNSLLHCWTATWVSLWHIIFSFLIGLFCQITFSRTSCFLLWLRWDPLFFSAPDLIPYWSILVRFLADLPLSLLSRYCLYALNLPEYLATTTMWQQTPLSLKSILPYRLSLLSYTNPPSFHSFTKCGRLLCELMTWYEPSCTVNGTRPS